MYGGSLLSLFFLLASDLESTVAFDKEIEKRMLGITYKSFLLQNTYQMVMNPR